MFTLLLRLARCRAGEQTAGLRSDEQNSILPKAVFLVCWLQPLEEDAMQMSQISQN